MSDPVPHKPAHSYQPAPQRPVEPGKSSHTILVVDDDSAIRTLVKLWLEMEGYGVLMAADAETAMKLYDPSTVALLLTDVVMPDISGLELADQLLRREPQLRILFMSGSEDASRGFGCVAKPFTGDGLIRRVGEVLKSVPSGQVAGTAAA
jgi:two-component system, cell cycle sensor histidine kinase and response regulator CckA